MQRFWLISSRKRTRSNSNGVTTPINQFKINYKEKTKQNKNRHISVSPTGWPAGRHSYAHMCTRGPSHTPTLGPKSQQPPLLLYSLLLLCVHSAFSSVLSDARCSSDVHALTCVQDSSGASKNIEKRMAGERGQMVSGKEKKKKQQSVGAEEEEGCVRLLKRQARLPLHLHTAGSLRDAPSPSASPPSRTVTPPLRKQMMQRG